MHPNRLLFRGLTGKYKTRANEHLASATVGFTEVLGSGFVLRAAKKVGANGQDHPRCRFVGTCYDYFDLRY